MLYITWRASLDAPEMLGVSYRDEFLRIYLGVSNLFEAKAILLVLDGEIVDATNVWVLSLKPFDAWIRLTPSRASPGIIILL